MKNTKKALFLTLLVGSMSLVGCGGNNSDTSNSNNSGNVPQSSVDNSKASDQTSEPDPSLPKYEVKIDYDDGTTPTTQEFVHGAALTKPADPTVPAGKTFYGWRNVKNGGQIWNFEAEDLNVVMQDVELKPLFIDSSLKEHVFEAELCPDITETMGENGTYGMDGATYSGGAQGKQLINKAYDGEFGASGSFKILSYDDSEADYGKADYATAADAADPDAVVFGGYVHFMYKTGDTLTWELESDVAATNVTLFMRLSAEYGIVNPDTEELSSWVDDKTFPVKVNGQALEYGKVTLHNLVDKSFITFQDYFVSATVSLQAGKNTIQMVVDNDVTLNGTIPASAPCVDCIKLYSSSNITWPKAKVSQLDLDA